MEDFLSIQINSKGFFYGIVYSYLIIRRYFMKNTKQSSNDERGATTNTTERCSHPSVEVLEFGPVRIAVCTECNAAV